MEAAFTVSDDSGPRHLVGAPTEVYNYGMTVINHVDTGLAAVRAMRDEARLEANRLSDICDQVNPRDHWTAQDAFTAYRVAEAYWQGLNDAVRAFESGFRP